MFSKEWFLKHQKYLLQLANTEAGKYLLGTKDPIIKLTPNSCHQFVGMQGKKPIIRAKFQTSDWVAEVLAPILTKMDLADRYITDPYGAFLHFSGLQLSPKLPQIFLATMNPVSNAADGRIWAHDTTWAAVRAAASGTVDATIFIQAFKENASSFYIGRGNLPFDTSSLTAGATVTAATLDTYPTAKGDADNGATGYITVTQSTFANAISPQATDFPNFGTTEGIDAAGRADITGITLSATLTFTLNATGIGFVNKTGYTQLALKIGYDNANVEVTGNNYVQFNSSADVSGKPTLNITYTPAPAGGMMGAAEI